MSDLSLPAWSDAFTPDARAGLLRTRSFGTMDRRAAFGDRQGHGVTVAIIDSGVEPAHPAIGGGLARSLQIEAGDDGPRVVDDPDRVDLVGHGTACAGMVRASRRKRSSSRSGSSVPTTGPPVRHSRPLSSGRSTRALAS